MVPGGHAERRQLLPGAVALAGQALLRLTLLEKKGGQGAQREAPERSWGPNASA